MQIFNHKSIDNNTLLCFSENFSSKRLPVSILLSTFAIATIPMRSIPHKQRARRYVQARPIFFLGCGLIFLPVPYRIELRVRPLFMRSIPHLVDMQITEYGGSPSTCFFCPLWRISMGVVADEEVRAAFFVPYRQPYPTESGIRLQHHYYANNCINSAHSSFASVDH